MVGEFRKRYPYNSSCWRAFNDSLYTNVYKLFSFNAEVKTKHMRMRIVNQGTSMTIEKEEFEGDQMFKNMATYFH